MKLVKRKKVLAVCILLLILFIFGGSKQYIDAQQVHTKIVAKKKIARKAKPSPTPTPTPSTGSGPTATPTFTVTPSPTLVPPTATPTPTVTSPTATPTTQSTQTTSEQFSFQMFDPPFLWADYLTVGPTEATITGSGFTSQTTVELFPTRLDPIDQINPDATYPLSVTFISSHELRGKLPSGLYNSYYGVRIKNPDGAKIERSNMIVVSGNTQAAGTAPHPEE